MLKLLRGLKNTSGFTLTEILVAAGLSAVIAAGGATTYNRLTRSGQELELRETMGNLHRDIRVAFATPANLTRSMTHPENAKFFQCFGGKAIRATAQGVELDRVRAQVGSGSKVHCDATSSDQFYPLVLQTLNGTVLSGGTDKADGTRSTNSKRILTARGRPCTEAEITAQDELCEIEVTTAFRAVCGSKTQGAVSSCVTPDTAEFFVSVQQLRNGRFFKNGIVYPAVTNMQNSDGTARKRVDAVAVSASDFMRPDFFECPKDTVFRGFNERGEIQCNAQVNPCESEGKSNWVFHGLDANGKAICKKPLQDEVCPNPDSPLAVLRGVKSAKEGRELDCVNPQISNQGCKPGEVLVGFDYGPTKKKKDPYEITKDDIKAICLPSVHNSGCPQDKFLVGYDKVGNPRCVSMKTPNGNVYTIQGPKCGHQHGNCSYSSKDKPEYWTPQCPEDEFTVMKGYSGIHCCASCGWGIGQWWCDYNYVICSPYTTATWQ